MTFSSHCRWESIFGEVTWHFVTNSFQFAIEAFRFISLFFFSVYKELYVFAEIIAFYTKNSDGIRVHSQMPILNNVRIRKHSQPFERIRASCPPPPYDKTISLLALHFLFPLFLPLIACCRNIRRAKRAFALKIKLKHITIEGPNSIYIL